MALNFIQKLSAVASRTRELAMFAKGTPGRVFDTRKTIPGLSDAQKYAVKVGGGDNHRIGLFDKKLIKENHIESAGGITQAIQAARQMHPTIKVQVESKPLWTSRKHSTLNRTSLCLIILTSTH